MVRIGIAYEVRIRIGDLGQVSIGVFIEDWTGL